MPADGGPTRDRILDSFEKILVSGGTRSATIDAVAAEAAVSKGGLLYHFRSKDDLLDGMLARLAARGAEDVEKMRNAPGGPVDYYLETSIDSGSDFDRALIAAARVAYESEERATRALAALRDAWFLVLRDHLGDDSLARTIQLIGDGLYFDDTTGLTDKTSLSHVRNVLKRLGALDS
ncbi:MAG: TetR family transcriptional regulator [Nocardioidaceae bacterium]|nr:TetR family transcriptional regulator [Nocardioidaceae bacterium]